MANCQVRPEPGILNPVGTDAFAGDISRPGSRPRLRFSGRSFVSVKIWSARPRIRLFGASPILGEIGGEDSTRRHLLLIGKTLPKVEARMDVISQKMAMNGDP
jgi:hypothetical protein